MGQQIGAVWVKDGQTEEQRIKQVRKQKGYIDTIADLRFIKESDNPIAVYKRFAGRKISGYYGEGQLLAFQDFMS